MSKYCENCGRKLEGATCVCTGPPNAGASRPPPSGFTLDPSSGLYYIYSPGRDESGQSGRWITWFYPDTGGYVQDFLPDAPTATYTAQPVNVNYSRPLEPARIAREKNLSPAFIIMPVAALIIGVVIAFIQS